MKTKRVLILIKRNVKLNFYVGFLKYSHLEELKKEVIEAANFYQSFFILVVAVAFGPYRMKESWQKIIKFYKDKR